MRNPPIAYFLTWTTYGTWLPGDDRWWTESEHGKRPPDFRLRKQAQSQMTEPAVVVSPDQRNLVEATIRDHCEFRGWKLWTMNCRTNHVHVVVTANVPPDQIVRQLKAWCTRRLKEQIVEGYIRQQWWTEGASKIYLNTDDDLQGAVIYVRDCQ